MIKCLKVGEIILFPIWIILFPVLKINFEPHRTNEKHFLKKVFDQRPGSWRNNSISCLDDSISCFENQCWTTWSKWKTFCNRSFLIRDPEVGDIIPFPVWIIPFTVLKINYEPLETNGRHFLNEVLFLSEACKWEK